MCEVTKNDTLIENNNKPTIAHRKWEFVWFNIVFFTTMHIGSLYGIYLLITKAKWQTWMFAYVLYLMSTVGVTAGVHRLWAHKAYKAKLPLKIILLLFFTISFQGSVHQWVRDHRGHHKYCDTDADPHNSTRGFFFSHIGWLLIKKHPEIKAKKQDVEMNDIRTDKLLSFQRKYYYLFVVLLSYLAPTYISVLWNEEKWVAFFVTAVLRITFSLHVIFLINSAAHMWGTRPYNKEILPVETKTVSFVACGEGYHNYHHTFPWDYRAAELGGYTFNASRMFIDAMAKIGWAYDLRTASKEMIQSRVQRTGDGTHPTWRPKDKDIHLDHEQTTQCCY